MSKNILTHKPMAQVKVTCFYGPRKIGIKGSSTNHRGLDMGGTATALKAAASGKVIANGWNNARGWFLEIRINERTTYFYQHMAKRSSLKIGASVKSGQIVGAKGATGLPGMSPHLHMEIRVNGNPVNPLPYMVASYQSMPIVHTISPIKSNAETVWPLEAKRLQEHLKKMGLYKGNIDGKPEKKTGDAIAAFQKKYKLTQDRKFGPACRKKLNQLGYK